ncbi:hypothetical protein LZ30DRAFT_158451 [Colletotrichum cereale]|nr:hypothetical protein LZ30DRAFT_158451 [Colletotrichum cereale]
MPCTCCRVAVDAGVFLRPLSSAATDGGFDPQIGGRLARRPTRKAPHQISLSTASAGLCRSRLIKHSAQFWTLARCQARLQMSHHRRRADPSSNAIQNHNARKRPRLPSVGGCIRKKGLTSRSASRRLSLAKLAPRTSRLPRAPLPPQLTRYHPPRCISRPRLGLCRPMIRLRESIYPCADAILVNLTNIAVLSLPRLCESDASHQICHESLPRFTNGAFGQNNSVRLAQMRLYRVASRDAAVAHRRRVSTWPRHTHTHTQPGG